MATGGEWSCPICCNALGDAAYSMPCCHQFCLGCILRWVRENRTCPLCRTPISTVSFCEREEDCLQSSLWHPREAPEAGSLARDAPGSRGESTSRAPPASSSSSFSSSQGTLSPAGQGSAGPQAVGGILPELWAELFRRRRNLLDPVRTWLRQGLEVIHGDKWWQVKVAESSVLLALCTFGPDRDVLVQRLQVRLKEHTAPLVHGIVDIIETQCSQEVQRLRRSHGPRAEGQSPGDIRVPTALQGRAPASSSIPNSSGEEAGAGAPEDALQASPRCHPAAPVPAGCGQP